MRISDWSSDVCSSDLQIEEVEVEGEHAESHGEQQPMGAPGKAERVACEQGPEEDHCSGDREAVGDGEFRRHQPDLVRQGDPGGSPDEHRQAKEAGNRKTVGKGKSVAVSEETGGGGIMKKKNNNKKENTREGV